MVTFRSGPRDPVTGRSSAVVSDPGNIVRASGQTDNERAARQASYTSYEPAAVQASERNARNEASYQQFLRDTGRTATNPYGNEGLFSRAFGISPDKLDYSGITPGGIATLEKVNRLAFDQFMNPRDARGNIRGMLREGSPTRYGPVGFDPSQATDFGIMGALPFVGPMLQRATRRSGLTIFPEDYGDLGNELGAFPDFGGVDYDTMEFFESSRSPLADPVAAAARSNPNATESRDDIFTPFTTDPDVRNPESYFADINTRPQETPVTPGFTRPDDAMPTVAEVIATEPMVTEPADPRLPTGPKVIQAIPGGDPGSASITVNPRSESPTYTAPDEPVDLLSDILAPDGSILPGVLDDIGSSETGRTSSAAPILDIPEGGFPDPRQLLFTPEQVLKANQNNAVIQRADELNKQGMPLGDALRKARLEDARAKLRTGQ
tara:strand:+ start:73 stop:1380 length:1308 start_codon:yes stop_codon:yes gene_type:complete